MTNMASRALRWVFSRGGATCRVELSLDHEAVAYELRFAKPGGSAVALERFRHVSAAFARHCELEAALVQDGWTLESCESVKHLT